ncbi:MAG: hypothetical protein UY13_C0002G0479 [Candidatus Pacebacteria bacterium GW2011_GWB1_47_8]|nr:MAG: hypothetical protein UX28_C0002G0038 [Candidatus Pacebacteria bacterium GW2011_GWA1_46_10]KKU84567.1 MAG: hypothetical protein UY13_C0002G0479 [Candidatus Pacebacteria bacterium GW2011_GWB1_47_8]HCR81651.1 hypothetical protein [Candidatus Paceibacterota bacterium]
MINEKLTLGRDLDEMVMGMNRKSLRDRVRDLIKRLTSKSTAKNSANVGEENPRIQEPIEL